MLNFKINQRVYKNLFDFPIRNRFDSIKMLINTFDYLINYTRIKSSSNYYCLEIFIKNLDGYRMFYLSENKIFTICSPFRISTVGDKVIITHNLIGEISNMEVSLLKRIFNEENIFMMKDAMNSYCLLEDIISEDFSNSNLLPNIIWELLVNLLNYESGYVRYDYDPENKKPEKIHPLHHLDISYNNYSTYKFGLHSRISIEDFIDIFDATTEQFYMKKMN